MASSTQGPPDLILWDVVEEHFNESEFLFEQWDRALHSPKYNLTELGATLEQRLAAHLDGLVVGGRPVAKRTLEPELENASEPNRTIVAALALLFMEEEKRANHVIELVQRTEGPLQEALSRALTLANVTQLDRLLQGRFRESRSDTEKAVFLDILTGRGVDPGESLRPCFESRNPQLVGAALKAAGRFARREMLGIVDKLLRADHRPTRPIALGAGLALGSRNAWKLCRVVVKDWNRDEPDLLLMIAILGRPEDHQLLYAQLDNPARTERILWNLGFCGTLEAGDACLARLQSDNKRVAKVAAEALAWIGGFDLNSNEFQAPASEVEEDETLAEAEESDLETNLKLDGVDDLPVPNREAIAQWWKENRERLPKDGRQVFGRPFSAEAMVHALEAAALWRRHGVALELSIRTGGKHVSTDAFSSRQRRQIAALEGISLGQWSER